MALLIALLVCATVTLVVLSVLQRMREDEILVEKRLARLASGGPVLTAHEVEMRTSLFHRVLRPLLHQSAGWVGRITPRARIEQVRERLARAGYPGGLQPLEFLGLKLAGTVALPAALFLLGSRQGAANAILLGTVGLLAAVILPELVLRRRIAARQKDIVQTLPDVLDLLTVSVEAGLGFDGAVAKVVEKTRGALGEEFQRLLQEIRVGKPRRDALRDMGKRSGVEDLRSFVAAIVQADRLGVSIGKVLRVQAAEMRRRRRQRAEEAAMKAPIKMLFPLIFFVFPALFIVLLGPAVIQLLLIFRGV